MSLTILSPRALCVYGLSLASGSHQLVPRFCPCADFSLLSSSFLTFPSTLLILFPALEPALINNNWEIINFKQYIYEHLSLPQTWDFQVTVGET